MNVKYSSEEEEEVRNKGRRMCSCVLHGFPMNTFGRITREFRRGY